MTDSSTGGYLSSLATPAPVPTHGDALADVLQAIVVGITGLPGNMVRPRWQHKPPAQPPAGADWAAIGIVNKTREGSRAAFIHHPEGEGHDEMRRHEELDILVSFYGPGQDNFASILSDGIGVPQNHEALYNAGLGLIEVGTQVWAPEQVGQQWIGRCDLSIRLRRRVERHYPVLNVKEAQGEFRTPATDSEVSVTPLSVKESS